MSAEHEAPGRITTVGRRSRCPWCGSRDVARIRYGYPIMDEEIDAELKAGELALGGCVVTPSQADRSCRTCGRRFRRDGKPASDDGDPVTTDNQGA